jgi:2-hydroxy-5-methyl-1-naphthoate 7-hydroxylase
MSDSTRQEFDFSGRLPHEDHVRLRDLAPAVQVTLPGDLPVWSVTRDEVIRRLTEDPRVSRDARNHWSSVDKVAPDSPFALFLMDHTVLNTYGNDRKRLRDIMELSFTASRLEALRQGLSRGVEHLLDTLAQSAGTDAPVDLRNDYGQAIGAEILIDLFGVPADMQEQARSAMGFVFAPDPQQAAAGMQELMGFLGALMARLQEQPSTGMVSELMAAGPGQGVEPLTQEEILLMIVLTMGAGGPTTGDLIANAIHALLTRPQQRDAVVGGRVSWEAVIEETLRLEAPVQYLPFRVALEDIALDDGVVIRKGEAIMLGFGVAGRDPAVHGATAADFDAERVTKEHLSFGHGVHHCVGAPLARMAASIALPALFARFPAMELAVPAAEIAPLPTFLSNGRLALPVRLQP